MSTYAIGDVQGCYNELMALLDKIAFNPTEDTLWFAGDLVNRGPKSLETLRYISKLPNVVSVLGNHDLHLLALAYGHPFQGHGLDDILNANDKHELCEWVQHRPLIHVENHFSLSHAGLYPFWTLDKAEQCANEVHDILRSEQLPELLKHMYGDTPTKWNEDLIGWERYRFIINAFTRMRFCSANGELELNTKGPLSEQPDGYVPWFTLPNQHPNTNLLFGHWAALKGKTDAAHVFALDSGCVWGGTLSALRLEDQTWFHVPGIKT